MKLSVKMIFSNVDILYYKTFILCLCMEEVLMYVENQDLYAWQAYVFSFTCSNEDNTANKTQPSIPHSSRLSYGRDRALSKCRYHPTRRPPWAAQWDVWPRTRAIAACLARLRDGGGMRGPLSRQLSGRRPCPRRHPRRPPQPWRPGHCAPPPTTTRWLLGHPHGRRPQPQELQTSHHAHIQVRLSNESRS